MSPSSDLPVSIIFYSLLYELMVFHLECASLQSRHRYDKSTVSLIVLHSVILTYSCHGSGTNLSVRHPHHERKDHHQ